MASTSHHSTVSQISTKQKIVLKVALFDKKSQSKALKIAVGILGVESARFLDNDKSKMEIVGDGVDAVEVANLLKKKIGLAELINVSAVEEKEEQKFNYGVPQFVKNGLSNFFKLQKSDSYKFP